MPFNAVLNYLVIALLLLSAGLGLHSCSLNKDLKLATLERDAFKAARDTEVGNSVVQATAHVVTKTSLDATSALLADCNATRAVQRGAAAQATARLDTLDEQTQQRIDALVVRHDRAKLDPACALCVNTPVCDALRE